MCLVSIAWSLNLSRPQITSIACDKYCELSPLWNFDKEEIFSLQSVTITLPQKPLGTNESSVMGAWTYIQHPRTANNFTVDN